MTSLILDISELTHLLNIRLLIARAGQKDRMRWWEDDSLSDAGAYLLERLFPFAPHVHGRKLALAAAKARHMVVFADNPSIQYLYHLGIDGEIEYALSRISLDDIDVPGESIDTTEKLRQHLVDLIGEPPQKLKINKPLVDRRLPVQLSQDATMEQRINALAWAYLQGAPEQPVFPFLQE